MTVDISCAFATSMETPHHVALAERLGYRRAWLYDSPPLYPDVWVTLARAASLTETIGLGPGVLVPSLRHPMTNAAAIATLADLAPGRVAVAIGSGFTGRMTLGQRPLRWAYVREYISAIRALLRGDEVGWEGSTIRMLQPPGHGAARPLDVPILVGADGPKGEAVARELGDGVFSTTPRAGFEWAAVLQFGTVLDDGETADSERAMAAAGHAVAVVFHALYERRNPLLEALPGGAEWKSATEALPPGTRHLAVHEDHLVAVTERDRTVVTGDLVRSLTLTGTVDELAGRIRQLELSGVTEIAYQPAGPDIPRELEAFARLIPVVA